MSRSSKPKFSCGMSLLELVIAMAISSVLTLTLVSMAVATRNSFRLQESLAELQENARYFGDLLSSTVAASGYHPQPWLHEETPIGLMPESEDDSGNHSDRLVIRSWSEHNCFGTPNTRTDSFGRPVFYLKESTLELNLGSLAHSCRYGQDASSFTTQINRQGAIPQAEAFQVLYATDIDADGTADAWLRANQWASPRQVLAVRLALVSSSRESVTAREQEVFQVLDHKFSAPADGRVRRVVSFTVPVSGARQ